jgi:hypothetical protein
MTSYTFSNTARPTMAALFRTATLREINGEGTTLENGKNAIDVWGGCMPPYEAIDLVHQFGVLGVNHPAVQKSYEGILRTAIEQIHEESPDAAREVLKELQSAAREEHNETPWIWYTAQSMQADLGL